MESEHRPAGELEQEAEARRILDSLEEITTERREKLLTTVRTLAELARKNGTARAYLEKRLEGVARSRPMEVKTFRAYYLEGEQRESAREIGLRFYMGARTVYSHNRRVLEALLPSIFGIYGVFQERTGPGEEVGQ